MKKRQGADKMKTNYNYDYDEENDILYIYRQPKNNSRIKGSLDVANFVIDINYDNNVSGLEILDSSEVLKNIGIKEPREVLQNIQKVQINAVRHKDSIVVNYTILSKVHDKQEKIGASVAVPVGH